MRHYLQHPNNNLDPVQLALLGDNICLHSGCTSLELLEESMRTMQLSLKGKDYTFGIHDKTGRDYDGLIGLGLLARCLTFIVSGNSPCGDGTGNDLKSRGGRGVIQEERCGSISGFRQRHISA